MHKGKTGANFTRLNGQSHVKTYKEHDPAMKTHLRIPQLQRPSHIDCVGSRLPSGFFCDENRVGTIVLSSFVQDGAATAAKRNTEVPNLQPVETACKVSNVSVQNVRVKTVDTVSNVTGSYNDVQFIHEIVDSVHLDTQNIQPTEPTDSVNNVSVNSTDGTIIQPVETRPVLDAVRNKCLQTERTVGNYSIDEQIIPFTGRCSLKNYVPNKPRSWGLKTFILTTVNALMLNSVVYQEQDTPQLDRALGLGPAVILRLQETVPRGSDLYFDRFATGTIMANRLRNVTFPQDIRLKRGDVVKQTSDDDDLTAVKWENLK
ncbi:hypothetical protein PR048_015682 [Dryococelus australis]|uniref:PiggyBac transposable element-derived protein domain-containing protein n=1 Tax=Dryococelus australis TaxID=614101 RepID=A0ABQ9HHL5_9NEOP|nr:hypothetical protein PR048_015682 [Dryococelus australis]